MSQVLGFLARRAGLAGAVAAIVFHAALGAQAQSADAAGKSANARIDFDAADLPVPTVEVDLSQGMFRDLFGIGDAAIAGIAESMLKSGEAGHGNESTQLAAEQLAAARKIMQLASQVVGEVRVRVYRDLPQDSVKPESLAAQFDEQLAAGKWDNVVRVREGDQSVRVSLLRDEGAVYGVFVIAGEAGGELVLANLVCDVSPENVKKLTAAATTIGMENGLAQVIEQKMPKHRRAQSAPPAGPQE